MATLTGDIELRDYQHRIVRQVSAEFAQGASTALVAASTGAGKTRVFAHLVQKFLRQAPALRVLVMVNRLQLLEQTARVLADFGFDVGVVGGGKREFTRQVTVASYLSTINVRPVPHYNLVIWDEAHRFAGMLDDKTHGLNHWYASLKDLNPKVRDIGFTATPYTTAGRIYGAAKHFKKIAVEVGMKELLDGGYLCPVRSYEGDGKFNTEALSVRGGDYVQAELAALADDSELMARQVNDALMRLDVHMRQCVVWQCVSIKHVELVAARLRERGESVAVCHSEQEDFERTTDIAEFEAGKRRHLVFVSIVSEGYDHPPIDAIVILRPTKSPVLYVQAVGRVMRPHPSKTYSLLLDYGNVVRSCGPLDYPYVRQREDAEGGTRKTVLGETDVLPTELPVQECAWCGKIQFAVLTPALECDACGENIYEQREQAECERLTKSAVRLRALYSNVQAVPVRKQEISWKVDATRAHLITITYNDTLKHEIVVPAFNGRFNKARMGAYRHAESVMRELGFTGEGLSEMAVGGPCLYMPKYVMTDGKRVFETHGLQLIHQERVVACEAEQSELPF